MQHILSNMRKAIEDYNMIDEGDKIAVCLSGGKDSITMLNGLKALQRFYPKKTKELYRYIRNTYNVKGTRNYENYWNLFCECIEWNGFMISSVIDSIKSGCEALIDFIEGICQEAFISAFESIS